MNKFLKQTLTISLSIVTILFTFTPEKLFANNVPFPNFSNECNILIMRIIVFCVIVILVLICLYFCRKHRNSIIIKGHNYIIKIEYANLFELKDCKKVIPFDECFTTKVGNNPSDINPSSLCGQFLGRFSVQISDLLVTSKLKTLPYKSSFSKKDCYESGKLIPYNEDYLLLAFAKLDENGLGKFSSFEEYQNSLSVLWKEIDKYYGQKDVAIPILGSGVTRIDGEYLTQQQLLDIIIASYRLNSKKIKNPNKLHIVCKRTDGFSLNKIGENL